MSHSGGPGSKFLRATEISRVGHLGSQFDFCDCYFLKLFVSSLYLYNDFSTYSTTAKMTLTDKFVFLYKDSENLTLLVK